MEDKNGCSCSCSPGCIVILAGIGLLGYLAIQKGCDSDNLIYEGIIGKDHIEYYEEPTKNYIIATKPNDDTFTYINNYITEKDSLIDLLIVEEDGIETKYASNIAGGIMFERGQEKYDYYIQKIKENISKEDINF